MDVTALVMCGGWDRGMQLVFEGLQTTFEKSAYRQG